MMLSCCCYEQDQTVDCFKLKQAVILCHQLFEIEYVEDLI